MRIVYEKGGEVMRISDAIAAYILHRIDEAGDGSAELRRNELAEELGCVPSQINYVITCGCAGDPGQPGRGEMDFPSSRPPDWRRFVGPGVSGCPGGMPGPAAGKIDETDAHRFEYVGYRRKDDALSKLWQETGDNFFKENDQWRNDGNPPVRRLRRPAGPFDVERPWL